MGLRKTFKKIRAAIKLGKMVKKGSKEVTVNGETKPGYKTTEFWGKNVVQLLVILNMYKDTGIDPQKGLAIVTAIEIIYTFVRSIVKAFASKK